MILTPEDVKQIVGEINQDAEKTRRSYVLRGHEIYRDAGRRFIIEQLKREFGNDDAIQEFRIAPINILKKIVNKKSAIYSRTPLRTTELDSDQDLMDYYAEELAFDQMMMKANRYYNLHANTQIYFKPEPQKDGSKKIAMHVIPPHLYSVSSNMIDHTKADAIVFNAFTEGDEAAPDDSVRPVGPQGFTRERGSKTDRDKVNSQERDLDRNRLLIFWTDDQHFTTNNAGAILRDPEMDDSQFENPIGMIPSVNLAKDRDNEYWAKQGEDLIEMSLIIQLGLSDVVSTIKSQGFSILTIVAEEQPSTQHIGLNKAVWLKQREGGPTPSISYVQATSPIGENMDALMSMLRLLLTTNDMTPGTVSGTDSAKNAVSGFSQIIEMSDTLMAIEADKPALRNAELESWQIVAAWHNWMFDQNLLSTEARSLGRFSDGFSPQVIYRDVKPIESQDEILARVEKKDAMGLITKRDMIKELNPELSDDQIDAKLEEIAAEKEQNMARFQAALPVSGNDVTEEEESEEEDGSQ